MGALPYCRPARKLRQEGRGRGLDGRLYFGAKGTTLGIVSVKAGENIGVSMIRDLKGVTLRERAGVGVFLTPTEPTKPMIAEAASAGLHEEPGFAPRPAPADRHRRTGDTNTGTRRPPPRPPR